MSHPQGETGLTRRDDGIALIFIAESPKKVTKLAIHLGNPGLIPSGAETLVFWASQRLASLVAPTRRDDLKLSRGATAKLRENAVTQDHVQATNTIGITRKGPDFHAGRN